MYKHVTFSVRIYAGNPALGLCSCINFNFNFSTDGALDCVFIEISNFSTDINKSLQEFHQEALRITNVGEFRLAPRWEF